MARSVWEGELPEEGRTLEQILAEQALARGETPPEPDAAPPPQVKELAAAAAAADRPTKVASMTQSPEKAPEGTPDWYTGNVNLFDRPHVKNKDGYSSVRSMSFSETPGGEEILIPTVSDDGRIMTNDEAIAQYKKTGKNLGKFKTVEEANAAAERIHQQQAGLTPPEKEKVDYGAKYDEMMGAGRSDEEREALRTGKLSFKETLPYLLYGLTQKNSGVAIPAMMKARDAKRTGDVAAFDKARADKIKTYLERKKFSAMEAESDPNSELSLIAQAYMKKLDPTQDWTGRSAEELKPYLGPYLKIYESDAKQALAEAKMEQTKDYRSARKVERDEKAFEVQRRKDYLETNDILRTMAGSKRTGARGNFIQANNKVNLTEDGLRVIDQIRYSPLKGDPTLEHELAAILASSMMGGNQPAHETIDAFVSKTGLRTAAKIAKYLTANPQEGISKQMLDHLYHQLVGQNTFWKGKRSNSIGLFGISLERVWENPEYGRGEHDRFVRGVKELQREYMYKTTSAQREKFHRESGHRKGVVRGVEYWFDPKTSANMGPVKQPKEDYKEEQPTWETYRWEEVGPNK